MKQKLIKWTCDFCVKVSVEDDLGGLPIALPVGWRVLYSNGQQRHVCQECVKELSEQLKKPLSLPCTIPN